MKKYRNDIAQIILLFIISFSFLASQYVNQETGWSYYQSSNQSFYIFEEIQIDGEIAVGDGWAPSISQVSECYDNPNTCDVVGAFLDDVCVGWVYADSNGGTTLPLMGVDYTNDIIENLTQGYCQEGALPEIRVYDATYGIILNMSSIEELPSWENNIVHPIFNISFANNGIINPETLWFYYQSSEQAFYLFENVLIDGVECEENDIIGAFKNDLCVGWISYNPNGFTSVPVMGAEFDNFENYLYEGDVPEFKIYDFSNDEILDLVPSESLSEWSSNAYYFVNGDSQSAIYGCTDSFAENYNIDAQESCIDCCEYIQQIDLSAGWNMVSFNIVPSELFLFDILEEIVPSLQLVLDETGSAIFPDESGQDWTDNIGSWSNTEGYLIKVLNDLQINLANNERIILPLDIPLTAGWNIISYPAQQAQDIQTALDPIISNGNLFSVFDEGGNVYIPGIINSINSFQPGEAYYVKVNSDDILPINEGDGVFDNIIVDAPLYRTEHFDPIWSGNPFSPMTFFVDEAMWNQVNLVEGDEIGIFDGQNCVGAAVVPSGGFQSESGFQIVTSKDDGSGNGYIEGNEITFRVWRQALGVDMDIAIDAFKDELGNPMSPNFEALRAPFVELNAYPPSLVQNFVTTGQDQQVELTWNMPAVGNYQIYNYPDPGSSNAITFSIYRSGNLQVLDWESTVYIDQNLDNNNYYEYQIEAVSPVDLSLSPAISAITLPGVPLLSTNSFENAISVTWSDPPITGDASEITYNLQRQWVVGDSTYTQQIANAINEQIFLDQGLLNSTEYSYRVQAVNSTGLSEWSDYFSSFTLDPSASNFVSGLSGETIQSSQPPDNIVELFWDSYDGALYYRVYEQNVLIADNILDASYIDQGRDLQTSTIYRYVVTAMTASGETSPSSLLEIETLPELPPDPPSGMSVASSQNSFNLSWNNVPGYGDPIGGAAAQYNIYRYDLDDVQSGVLIGTNTGLNNTAYSDNNIDDNITYCYGVTGVNSEDNEGGVSEIVCATTPTQLAASTPQNLQASSGRTNVNLSWSASSGSPTINYQVYRDGEFVVNTTSTSYSDTNLASSTEYVYYVVAWNELGPSSPSDSVSSTTSGQTHLLSSEVPEDISVQISESARASNYIDGYAEITWDAKEYVSHPFELSYSGNPYSPHTIVINNPELFEAGDVIGVFDRDEQLCVGTIVAGEGTWPQMSASKDDGSGNGFIEGHAAYFKVWRSATGHVHTITESPSFTFSGLGLNYVDLTIHDELYKVFRNGEVIVSNLESEFYQDTELESGMTYYYNVNSSNVLGAWTESNPSESESVNTLNSNEYPHNAPVLALIENHEVTEDGSIGIFLDAFDEDGDELIYFAEPVDPSSPVVCDIDGSTLTLAPAPDFYDEDGFDIAVTVYDDYNFYETNTLSDQGIFQLSVISENDPPVLLNSIEDIQVLQGDFEDYIAIDISNVFIDADVVVMNEDDLVLDVSNSDNNVVNTYIENDSLYIQYLNAGVSEVYISSYDQYEYAYDTLIVNIDQVLSADDFVWPEDFKISNIYPNPFNPSANFDIEVPVYSNIEINIYNLQGKFIGSIFNGNLSKGVYQMSWDASAYSSGIYFISMKSESGTHTKKAILLK